MDVFTANVEQTIIALRYFLVGTYILAFFVFLSGVRIRGTENVRRVAAYVCALVGLTCMVRLCIIGYVTVTAPEVMGPMYEAAYNWLAFFALTATGVPLMLDHWLARSRPRKDVA